MIKSITCISLIFFIVIIVSACGGNGSNSVVSDEKKVTINKVSGFNEISVVDEITIGSQVWMSKNLDADKFRNGDPIPQAKTLEEWDKYNNNKQPAWIYYENDPINGEKYGKLYNRYAVNDPRGLAPNGWQIPNTKDLILLINYLGGKDIAGGKMKSDTGWSSTGFESNGDNNSKFNALPGGYLSFNSKWYFSGLTTQCIWWLSSETTVDKANSFFLGSGGEGWLGNSISIEDEGNNINGFYVRCIRE